MKEHQLKIRGEYTEVVSYPTVVVAESGSLILNLMNIK